MQPQPLEMLTKSELIDVWSSMLGGLLPFTRKYIEARYSRSKILYCINDIANNGVLV